MCVFPYPIIETITGKMAHLSPRRILLVRPILETEKFILWGPGLPLFSAFLTFSLKFRSLVLLNMYFFRLDMFMIGYKNDTNLDSTAGCTGDDVSLNFFVIEIRFWKTMTVSYLIGS